MSLIGETCSIGAKCIKEAMRHPKTPIDVVGNPVTVKQSPLPWWGSVTILVIGIGSWIAGATLGIGGLDEAGRAMVYMPLGSLFGMSMTLRSKINGG